MHEAELPAERIYTLVVKVSRFEAVGESGVASADTVKLMSQYGVDAVCIMEEFIEVASLITSFGQCL